MINGIYRKKTKERNNFICVKGSNNLTMERDSDYFANVFSDHPLGVWIGFLLKENGLLLHILDEGGS